MAKKREPKAGKKRQLLPLNRYMWRTHFYPNYDDGNDQVDPITPIRRTAFQKVLPYYEISTSETRDEGYGPAMDGVQISPYHHKLSAKALRAVIDRKRNKHVPSVYKNRGRNIDRSA